MQVLKFGGTSVANATHINKVIAIVISKISEEPLLVVVSALSGITDRLIQIATLAASNDVTYQNILQSVTQQHIDTLNELLPNNDTTVIATKVVRLCNDLQNICKGIQLLNELSPRTLDKVVSYGEILSSTIIHAAIQLKQPTAHWLDAQLVIQTNSTFGAANVNFETTNTLIQNYFTHNKNNVTIIPGFIAADANKQTTTLGRGGSDYTAAIFAAALQATNFEIWTDVSGMMTADPRLVSDAKHIAQISYQEAMELSHFGAKIIYPPTIQPVMQKNIAVWLKNTFAPTDIGTVITNTASNQQNAVTGISSINKISLLSLEGSGMAGIPGFSKRLFETLAKEKINVILISQSSSEHAICVAIDATNANRAKLAVDEAFEYEISTAKVEPLVVENNLAIIALVGDSMQQQTGIAGKMFHTLGQNGINIRAIAQGSSERNISAIIVAADVEKAVNVLHECFFAATYKQINLYLAGVGNVGKKLCNQLQQQQQYLQKQYAINIKLVGIANSKKTAINTKGIDWTNWETELENGNPLSITEYCNTIITNNLRNSIFVDVTANDAVANAYLPLLQHAIAVVACNKIASSGTYQYYKQLKDTSKKYTTPFLIETNVGAGLPVMGTLKDLLSSGDTITKIEGVLSGTLNYVFNNYNGTTSFATVVKQAQNEGFTEPDPRLDLSGKDVMRKIMILARECGATIEMDEITNVSFMPPSCMVGSVSDFYIALQNEEAHFQQLYKTATIANCKLKFVATYYNGKASVGLQHIDTAHDFYHLYGKDNIVTFYTNRYNQQPLVIKGAGAGADVTASGVFADIVRAALR